MNVNLEKLHDETGIHSLQEQTDNGTNKGIIMPDIHELPEEAQGQVTISLIQAQVELAKMDFQAKENEKQRRHESEEKQRDRDERVQARIDEKDERNEEREFAAARDDMAREYDSAEKEKDRILEDTINRRNNKGKFLKYLNLKNCAILLVVIFAIVVVIYYANNQAQKCKAPDSAKELRGQDYLVVEDSLRDAGFTNIIIEPSFDDNKSEIYDGNVKDITIGGRRDFTKKDKFDGDTVIRLTYYSIGKAYAPVNSVDVKGKNPDEIRESFEAAGFNSITVMATDEIVVKNQKKGTVTEVTINKTKQFTTSDIYNKSSDVIIKYYSLGFRKIPITLSECSDKNRDSIEEAFKKNGFINVVTNAVYDATSKNVGNVINVTINGMTYGQKDDEFETDSEIVITYHEYKSNHPVDEGEVMINFEWDDLEDEDYEKVESICTDAGFNNVKTVAVYDASQSLPIIGTYDDKEVFEITIAGNMAFEKYDIVRANSEVIIKYHERIENKPVVEGCIRVPGESDDFEDEDYNVVVARFIEAGFTNIKTESVADASRDFLGIIGAYNTDEVSEVIINGDVNYTKYDSFAPDAEVIIKYHVKGD